MSRISGSSYDSRLMSRSGDGSTLSLDFTAMGGVLDPRITFTRASNATFINSSGYVEWTKSNLLLDSNNLASANWFPINLTSRNATTAPDGSNTATEIVEDATNGGHIVLQITSNLNGLVYTASLYMKAGTNRTIGFIRDNNVSSDALVFYTLTGAGTATIANGAWGIVASIERVGTTDWYRCVFTIKAASTVNLQIGTAIGTAYGNWSFAGTVGNSINIWGAQVEMGSVARPLIVTTSSIKYDDPRFAFDPTTVGQPKGLLIESPVTNLCVQSQSLNVTWALVNLNTPTVPASPPTDPFGGTSSSWKLVATTANGIHALRHDFITFTAANYTFSFFAKAAEYDRIILSDPGTGLAACTFVLTGNGTATTIPNLISPTNATMTPCVGGWYRCSVTMPMTAATTRMSIGGYPVGATLSAFGATYTGDNSSGVYATAMQIELASQASSYIPTGVATFARAADTALITGTNFSSWYTGNLTGTFVTEWFYGATATTASTVIATCDVARQHLHQYVAATTARLRLANKVPVIIETANAANNNALNEGAFSYQASVAQSLCLNGGTVATGAFVHSEVPTWFSIGGVSSNGTSITDTTTMLNNSIRKIKYFPTRLSDDQIKALSTL